ncbi:class I SAM-dependent methyltransferase [Corynebacterium cystitidis]|uniref:class I SAM-dependent methyltransferase n=1 Tax=Corynebacterium cystitidis TaxID=35757 RepID=UPI00211DB1E1|nr:class I SAM-dependent methyltransferase [Corynebacterium cystitidis]
MPTWKEVTTANPDHSENYARRWQNMINAGDDIHGEARLVDALAPQRGSRILDAGCGQGRLGGRLAELGHDVVGTDLDEILIDHAKRQFPNARWYVGDLGVNPIAEDDFDVAVSAGNVMGFLAPEDREPALQHIFDSLVAGGRFVVGYGAGRGWEFPDFLENAKRVGFTLDYVFESWDLKPFAQDSRFMVALFTRPTD